jgi:hypothetical protein
MKSEHSFDTHSPQFYFGDLTDLLPTRPNACRSGDLLVGGGEDGMAGL